MAGVTNAPFRRLCRRYAETATGLNDGRTPGLFTSEMVMAKAFVEGSDRTGRMIAFPPDESPRSMQLYGTNPADVGEAVRILVGDDRVDHIDLNFGCPAAKVTRKGGGAAVPVHRALLASIIGAAVQAADPGGVPVTVKFRLGIDDGLLTYLDTGRIAADEGAVAIALHARTAEQHYAGAAHWPAIAQLKQHVTSIPVLGNGDILDGADAVRMMAETGCDGVVIGRGCLGRPWLFRDVADAFAGRPVRSRRRCWARWSTVLAEHGRLLAEWFGETKGMRELRKHTGWYLKGYPVGPELRRRLAMVSTLAEMDDLLAQLDPTLALPPRANGSCGATPAVPARSPCLPAGSTRSTTPPRPKAPTSSTPAADAPPPRLRPTPAGGGCASSRAWGATRGLGVSRAVDGSAGGR